MPKGVPYGKFVHDNFDASTTWRDIEWVRSIFPGKIILKGTLDPEDAKRALQTNIDGIVVSNHGDAAQAGDPRGGFVQPRMANPTADAPRAIDARTKPRADGESSCRRPGLPASGR